MRTQARFVLSPRALLRVVLDLDDDCSARTHGIRGQKLRLTQKRIQQRALAGACICKQRDIDMATFDKIYCEIIMYVGVPVFPSFTIVVASKVAGTWRARPCLRARGMLRQACNSDDSCMFVAS